MANLGKLGQGPEIAALTGATIRSAATRDFDPANYVKITLMPERQ